MIIHVVLKSEHGCVITPHKNTAMITFCMPSLYRMCINENDFWAKIEWGFPKLDKIAIEYYFMGLYNR